MTTGGSERRQGPGRGVRFTVSRVEGTVVLAVEGAIDFEEWCPIDGILRDLIDAQGNLDVVLDLWGVEHLEHAAVPLILGAAQKARSHGGRLRLADRACRDRSWRGRTRPEPTGH